MKNYKKVICQVILLPVEDAVRTSGAGEEGEDVWTNIY